MPRESVAVVTCGLEFVSRFAISQTARTVAPLLFNRSRILPYYLSVHSLRESGISSRDMYGRHSPGSSVVNFTLFQIDVYLSLGRTREEILELVGAEKRQVAAEYLSAQEAELNRLEHRTLSPDTAPATPRFASLPTSNVSPKRSVPSLQLHHNLLPPPRIFDVTEAGEIVLPPRPSSASDHHHELHRRHTPPNVAVSVDSFETSHYKEHGRPHRYGSGEMEESDAVESYQMVETIKGEEEYDDFEVEIPHEYLDPITQELMLDPVLCCDGYTYERGSIEKWLRTSHTSPMTNLKLQTKKMFENRVLKNLIEQFREKVKLTQEIYRLTQDAERLIVERSDWPKREDSLHKLLQTLDVQIASNRAQRSVNLEERAKLENKRQQLEEQMKELGVQRNALQQKNSYLEENFIALERHKRRVTSQIEEQHPFARRKNLETRIKKASDRVNDFEKLEGIFQLQTALSKLQVTCVAFDAPTQDTAKTTHHSVEVLKVDEMESSFAAEIDTSLKIPEEFIPSLFEEEKSDLNGLLLPSALLLIGWIFSSQVFWTKMGNGRSFKAHVMESDLVYTVTDSIEGARLHDVRMYARMRLRLQFSSNEAPTTNMSNNQQANRSTGAPPLHQSGAPAPNTGTATAPVSANPPAGQAPSPQSVILQWQKQAREANEVISQLRKGVSLHNETIAALNATIAVRDKTISQLKEDVSFHNKTTAAQKEATAAQEKTIAAQKKAIAAQEKAIAAQEKTIAAQEKDLKRQIESRDDRENERRKKMKEERVDLSRE
ncbi:hypothetical protein PROFUN_01103 [Planoprotostelium fungivorum]|uniref:U-box domain-containing protein n=1 Tax=Planoprotostelium fungivorum TaxID=1890364 RepID=A0A2P6NCA7_9EUKA|nr:hypothetical protein PROFUN_01103 [Planoprotostelium fungivorum]